MTKGRGRGRTRGRGRSRVRVGSPDIAWVLPSTTANGNDKAFFHAVSHANHVQGVQGPADQCVSTISFEYREDAGRDTTPNIVPPH